MTHKQEKKDFAQRMDKCSESHCEEQSKNEQTCCEDCHCEGLDVEKTVHKKSAENVEEKSAEESAQEYLVGWKRCQADFENYKKSQLNLQKNLAAMAIEDMVMQLLPVLDNFQASIEHVPDDQRELPWVQGLYYIQKQLETTLTDIGLEKVEVKEGDEFNPEIHEAIKSDNSEDDAEKGSVVKVKKVAMNGYRLKEKVIRPARVVTN